MATLTALQRFSWGDSPVTTTTKSCNKARFYSKTRYFKASQNSWQEPPEGGSEEKTALPIFHLKVGTGIPRFAQPTRGVPTRKGPFFVPETTVSLQGPSSIPVFLRSLHWQECHLLHRDQHPRLRCCPDWQGESQVPSPPTPPCQAPDKSHRPQLRFQTFGAGWVFSMERDACLTHRKTPLPTHSVLLRGFMEQLQQGWDLGALFQLRTHLFLQRLNLTKS